MPRISLESSEMGNMKMPITRTTMVTIPAMIAIYVLRVNLRITPTPVRIRKQTDADRISPPNNPNEIAESKRKRRDKKPVPKRQNPKILRKVEVSPRILRVPLVDATSGTFLR
jgi:hypothetical protein